MIDSRLRENLMQRSWYSDDERERVIALASVFDELERGRLIDPENLEPGTIVARWKGLFDAIERFADAVQADGEWSIVSAKAYEGEFIRFVERLLAERTRLIDPDDSELWVRFYRDLQLAFPTPETYGPACDVLAVIRKALKGDQA